MVSFLIFLLTLAICTFILPIFKFKGDEGTTYKQRLLSVVKLNSMPIAFRLLLTASLIYTAIAVANLYINRSEWDKPCHITYEQCELRDSTNCRVIQCVSLTDTTKHRTFYLDEGDVTIITVPDSCNNRYIVSGNTTEYISEYILTVNTIDNERDTLFIKEGLVKCLTEPLKKKATQP